MLVMLVMTPVLAAQTYAVTSVPNEFALKDISSYGTGLTTSLVNPATSQPDTDEGVVQAPLYFNFPFFGASYSQCYVSANGLLSFTPLTQAHPNPPGTVPDSGGPENFIAAMWKDLGRQPLSHNSQCVLHDTNIGTGLGQWEFRVQWTDWPDQGQATPAAFNSVVVCMYQATGIIEVHFGPLSGSYGFHCGVEGPGGGVGVAGPAGWQVTAAPGMAYRFTPYTPATPLTITTASTLADAVAGTSYSFQFAATGGMGPYYWADAAQTTTGLSLPAGWQLSTDGWLSAPAGAMVAGTYTFDIYVSDQTAIGYDTRLFTITVQPAGGGGSGGSGSGGPGAIGLSGTGGGSGGGCVVGAGSFGVLWLVTLVAWRRRRSPK